VTLGPTIGIADAQRFLMAVQAAGGTVPSELSNILCGLDALRQLEGATDPCRCGEGRPSHRS